MSTISVNLQQQRESRNLEELAAYSWIDADPILRANGAPRGVFAVPATPNFFSLLGVRAALGRTFGPQDKMGDALVVLSYSFWKTQLGGNPNVVGRTLDLDRKAYTIIGVMPTAFEFYPKEISMWRLMSHDAVFVRDPPGARGHTRRCDRTDSEAGNSYDPARRSHRARGAALLTRTLTSLLYDIRPADPLTFFWVTTALCAAAVIAVYFPARRAANLDPTVHKVGVNAVEWRRSRGGIRRGTCSPGGLAAIIN